MISSLKAHGGFRLRAALQLLLLVAAVFLFCYSTLVDRLFVTAALAFALIALCAFNLFRLVDDTERDFARFLDNIRHGDFNSLASPGEESSSTGRGLLRRAQAAILEKLRQLNRERDTDHRYLAMVIEHVNIALICFDESGEVRLLNGAARNLLGVRSLIHVGKLAQLDAGLAAAIVELRAGQQKVVRCVLGGEVHQLMISLSEFSVPAHRYRLLSLQDVKRALDENEIRSWRKLMRVLNHEVMNSMTPIVSLSRYADGFVGDAGKMARAALPGSEAHSDLQRSIAAIHSRSKGLVEFIGGYRGLHAPSRDVIQPEQLGELLERVRTLFAGRFAELDIRYESPEEIPPVRLFADIHSLEQILINLLANAIDAVAGIEGARIVLALDVSRSRSLQLMVRERRQLECAQPDGGGRGFHAVAALVMRILLFRSLRESATHPSFPGLAAVLSEETSDSVIPRSSRGMTYLLSDFLKCHSFQNLP